MSGPSKLSALISNKSYIFLVSFHASTSHTFSKRAGYFHGQKKSKYKRYTMELGTRELGNSPQADREAVSQTTCKRRAFCDFVFLCVFPFFSTLSLPSRLSAVFVALVSYVYGALCWHDKHSRDAFSRH